MVAKKKDNAENQDERHGIIESGSKIMKLKDLSLAGMNSICKAVMLVMYNHYEKNEGLGAADISRRAGVYRTPGIVHMNDAIVTGFMNMLYANDKVVRQKQSGETRGGWRLSESGYNVCLDIIRDPDKNLPFITP